MTLTMRDANENDARLISHIFATSWRTAYRGLIEDNYLSRLPDGYWVPSLRTWLSSGRMYGLLAMLDGRPVGAIVFGRGRDDEHGGMGEIALLYVLPEATGQGVGTALLKRAEELLTADGFDRHYLWAIEGNVKADGFYRKNGFTLTDERVRYRIGRQDVADVLYVK